MNTKAVLTGMLLIAAAWAHPIDAAAQAVGGVENARPVQGDPGMKTMRVFDTPQFYVMRDYAEPGAVRRMHNHAGTIWHVFVLVTGQLQLTVEGEPIQDVKQGDVLSLKGAANHTFKNTGAVTATIVEVFGKTPAAAGGAEVIAAALAAAAVPR